MRILHWFRGDLRLRDNCSLDWAVTHGDALLPLFVFDDGLLGKPRHGAKRVRFMHDCVERLARELEARGQRLVVRRGDPTDWLPRLAREGAIDCVSFNRDSAPRAKARDAEVERRLRDAGHDVVTHKDQVIWESPEVLTAVGRPFAVYTPYRKAWWKRYHEETPEPPTPRRLLPPVTGVSTGSVPPIEALLPTQDGRVVRLPTGGEAAALRRLRSFLERDSAAYAELRDFPAQDATSRLSPYLRFGAISIRSCFREAFEWVAECPAAERGVRKWLDELVWREFYHAILDVHPRVLHGAYRKEYDGLRWSQDEDRFQSWCDGRTGFPFIDAAMRQLLSTGWMHNRARMAVASFLVKDLWIDWRWGERFFMRHLVDGEPASNNGGWQWSASTGTDAQPYFRIFNPVRQSERYDPGGAYIRRYVPELAGSDDRRIHRPWTAPLETPDYPPPIVDHAEARTRALRAFESVRNGR